jgi:hypothetical protein
MLYFTKQCKEGEPFGNTVVLRLDHFLRYNISRVFIGFHPGQNLYHHSFARFVPGGNIFRLTETKRRFRRGLFGKTASTQSRRLFNRLGSLHVGPASGLAQPERPSRFFSGESGIPMFPAHAGMILSPPRGLVYNVIDEGRKT